MTKIYIGIGTNLGDRLKNLYGALNRLENIMCIEHRSSIYETVPKYLELQPLFLNMAVCGETELNSIEFLAQVKQFEVEIGRVPSEDRYGPRIIDLDILFFGCYIIEMPGLSIPHPRLAEREFVLKPLLDIAACKKHPVLGKTVTELLYENQIASDLKSVRYKQV